jgi:hypothetical protein
MNLKRFLGQKIIVFILLVLAVPAFLFPVELEKIIPIRIQVNIEWDHPPKSGNLRSVGTFMIQVTGRARLTEEEEEFLRYEPVDMQAFARIKNEEIMESPDSECYGKVINRIEGSGTVPITSSSQGLNSFLMDVSLGQLGKIAALQQMGRASEMTEAILEEEDKKTSSDNYIAALSGGFNATFQFGLCDGPVLTERGVIPFHVGIFKELTASTMSGSYTWESDEGFTNVDIKDFQGFKSLGPPQGGTEVKHRVSWSFGYTKPILQIWYKDKGGEEINITDKKNQDVKVGEKIELECRVLPESEGKPQSQIWTLDDGNSDQRKYIKRFEASKEQGKVIHLSQEDLNRPNIVFYWTDKGKGKVKCEAEVKGETITAETEFNISRPEYKLTVEPSSGSTFGELTPGEKLPEEECWVDEAYKEPKKMVGLQYNGITFECESSDEGEFQWVQLVEDYMEYEYFNRQKWAEVRMGLDHCYPYQSGKNALDKPAVIAPETNEGEGMLFEFKKHQKSKMYLMYKPVGEGSEWVPLNVIDWEWMGSIVYNDIEKHWWYPGNSKAELQGEEETSEYPEWDQNSGDKSKWKEVDIR